MPRRRAKLTQDRIDAAYKFLEEQHPTTGRAVGYHLFVRGLIASMSNNEMGKVYRILKIARESEEINWNWIVDQSRRFERVPCWPDLDQYLEEVRDDYLRDCWVDQPYRVDLWAEKSTVQTILESVLSRYHVRFLPLHGFSSGAIIRRVAQQSMRQPIIVLYVGDWDPSGMYMSECDLPGRFKDHGGGDSVTVKRVALTVDDLSSLPSFSAEERHKDPRYKWYIENYGDRCWELDAMPANDLRDCVEQAIRGCIYPYGWKYSKRQERAERRSLKSLVSVEPDSRPV